MRPGDDSRFPGYGSAERLHAGARATVYRARRLADDEPVVLKVASAIGIGRDEALARVRHELALLASIDCDRVIRGHDVAMLGDDAVLIEQDIGGESLDRHLARGRLPLAEALELAIGMADALRAVHAAGIVHKDVTPNNIVYNAATCRGLLIDFDLATARRTDHEGGMAPRNFEGTPRYMAPEQTGRMNRAADSRADLYSFGVTLFEMVTGRLPFVETDLLSIVHAHMAVRPPAADSVEPSVPRPVAAIVARLLAKAPEDRYQTAEGLLADLRICAARLAATGSIAEFALGHDDVTSQFTLPAKLYGRAVEIAALANAFDRSATGEVEVVLVAGHSGVGKSSVVRELVPLAIRRSGYFLSGKFDQLRGDTPYPALIAALNELVHQLLTEDEAALARWRDQIAAAVAPAGQVVVDAIPALARILGPQPPVVELDAAATRYRFHLTLQKLLQVFTRRAHPLVVFLDDTQWADSETLQLLKQVALSEATEAFLLIVAFRDNEVSDSHPVMAAARELGKHRRLSRLELAPLPAAEIAALIGDTLHQGAAAVEPLARLVCRKTDGNPFFARQLLRALHDAGHIAFDAGARQFRFDIAAIERAPISENVADLLADSLGKLPPSTQQILALAAAIGNRFELDMLSIVSGRTPHALHAELAPALDHELVVPVSELEFVAARGEAGLVFRRLRFQHDRIQRAAYAGRSAGDQQRMHLQIGELLRADASAAELEDRIFDVVSHLNRAAPLIDTPDLRRELARLNAMAARKARHSGAYAIAIDCLEVAVARFDWQAEYREQLEAHAMLAECRYLEGDIAGAQAVLEAADARVVHDDDRGTLDALRAMFSVQANDFGSVIRFTRRAAALRGLPLPDDAAAVGPAIGAALVAIAQRLGDRPIEAVLELPVMTDRNALALVPLFRDCLPAAFQTEPALGALMAAQMVLLSLEHGNCDASARGYGTLVPVLRGTPLAHLAYRMGKLALDLNRRLDDRSARPSVMFVFGLFAAPFDRPIEEAIECMRDAARDGHQIGDRVHAAFAAAHEIAFRVFAGSEPLADIHRDAGIYRQQCREIDYPNAVQVLTAQIDRLRVLMGELDAMAAVRSSEGVAGEAVSTTVQIHELTALLDASYAIGDDATALATAAASRALEPSLPKIVTVLENRFHHCLVAAAVCRRDPSRRAELEPVIVAAQRELAPWTWVCPSNFEAMYLLVAAELAALAGELDAALSLYDRAIGSAARHGRRRLEALGNELHGGLWLDRDKVEFAHIYLLRARVLYVALGAHRKVRMIDRRSPGLVQAARMLTTVTGSATAEGLDVTAIAKATRAISGELELDKLLERMLIIIFETAGAEGGALVLETPHGAVVAASRAASASQISTAGVPLAEATLPRALIRYVQRTETAVVLDDATVDLRFGQDDYIRTRQPQSVLCMPIKHKERLLGVLYLENTLVSGAFTQARLEALTILVSQLAVSHENATLFAAQRVHAEAISRANQELRSEITVRERAERELARHRTQLEELVAERTQELTLANQKLRAAAAERERIEAELRLAQKLESVGRLAAGIAHEINTPVQFASDNLVFVRDALPSLVETIGRYRDRVQVPTDDDVDYALAHTPGAVDAALEGLGRVTAIVRSMKEFARPDRDEKTLVDLNRAIESTLVIAANECKYVAEVHTELAALPPVRCNGGEINQAVLNLVINAAHAIRDVVGATGGKGKIVVRTRLDGDEIEIAVSDTGTGIAAAISDKIYDPFFTTKEVGRGTGQGLAIVRSVVVDKHGGSLRFETQAGAGTTFFLRLPVGARQESAA